MDGAILRSDSLSASTCDFAVSYRRASEDTGTSRHELRYANPQGLPSNTIVYTPQS